MKHLFDYKWKLSDGYPAKGMEKHGLKVFGIFICGGGSTMGYKLAGYNHLGGVEIDPKIAKIYKINHNPKYIYVEDVRTFINRFDLPDELYNLDILDGSPPCSTFSMAGSREKSWGKIKSFTEGQKKQRLDDLFFEFIKVAKLMQPKVIIAENVKGLIQGNAKVYVSIILNKLNDAGYNTQLFLLNAASMGVPQKRERIFFIARRKDLNFPQLNMQFNEKSIVFSEIDNAAKLLDDEYKEFSELYLKYWNETKQGQSVGKYNGTAKKVKYNGVANTVTAGSNYGLCHPVITRPLSKLELCMIGSFPLDYNFNDKLWHFIIGMSVPPVMMAQIANQIYLQWFKQQ